MSEFGIALFYSFDIPASCTPAPIVITDACIDLMFYRNDTANDYGAEIIGPNASPYSMEFRPGYSYFGIRFLSGQSLLLTDLRLSDTLGERIPLADVCLRNDIIERVVSDWNFGAQIEKFVRVYGKMYEGRDVSGKQVLCDYIVGQILGGGACVCLNDFERETGYTRQYINRVFQEQTGFSVMRFLKIIRTHRLISKFAVAPDEKIGSQIAAEMGFSDQSHMIREFKRYVGVTPSQFIRAEMGVWMDGS
ncbi:MAG: helix-turn-helix domain-containing protein [Oscillospiraceae bacterium]|nr:helix-turn-helix domain-containing protein [Oscillospiraceae bacterium]